MGIKRGENGTKVPAALDQFSAAHCCQSKMNYLCAFLLLAFATGSVHSTYWSSSDYYKPVFEEEFTKHCESHFPIIIPKLHLLNPVTLPLIGVLGEVTGLQIDGPLQITVILDSFILHIQVLANLACDSFQTVEILIVIHADCKAYLEDGCGFLGLSSSPTVELSINGLDLNPNKILINEVLKSLKGSLTYIVENILDMTLLSLNCFAKSFTSVHIIGGQPCHYELSAVEIVDGGLHGVCCLHTDEGSACSEGVEVGLVEGVVLAVGLTDIVLEKLLSAAIGRATYQVQVPGSFLGDLADIYGPLVHLRVLFTGIDTCSFAPHGVDISLFLSIQLFVPGDTETLIISFSAKLELTAAIIHEHGYWGLQLAARVSAALALTVVDNTCGCDASVIIWFTDFLTCHLNAIIGVLNDELHLCLRVPLPGGITPARTEIIPQQGFCHFHYFL